MLRLTRGEALAAGAAGLGCGLPAARITDLCVCAGPPDIIVKASISVIICGLPAARLGDQTAHGGFIVTGMVNVLIGG